VVEMENSIYMGRTIMAITQMVKATNIKCARCGKSNYIFELSTIQLPNKVLGSVYGRIRCLNCRYELPYILQKKEFDLLKDVIIDGARI